MGSKIVTTLADDGQGSLRDITRTACPGDTIRFDASLDMDTIKLTTGEITLDKNLVIIGKGISNTIVSGSDNSRIFHIPSGDTVQISGVTMTDGNETGTGTFAFGGAIFNQGSLHIADCLIANNTVSGDFAGLGGGISNEGTMTIINSTVSGNKASANSSAEGGGIQSCDSLLSPVILLTVVILHQGVVFFPVVLDLQSLLLLPIVLLLKIRLHKEVLVQMYPPLI